MRFIANRTAALETSDQNSRQLFDEAPIGMAVVGLDEHFQKVNARFAGMVGYPESELLSRTPLDITHPEDLEETKRLVRGMLAGTERCEVEKRYIRRMGKSFWVTRTAASPR